MPQYDEDVEIQNGHKLQIDYDGDYYVNLNTIMIGGDPLLQIDRGIKALKDLNIYGFIGMSTDQQKVAGGAALMMGHGFTSSTDVPQISLTDSELINCISYSETFLNGVWTAYDGAKTNITNGYLCPDGTNYTAYKIQNCGQSGGCRGCYQSSSPSLQQNHKYTASIWIKGTYNDQPVMIGLNDSYHTTVSLTTGWKRYFYTVTIPPGGSTSRGLQFNSGITGDTYYVWGAQLEEGPEYDFPGVYRSYVKTENGPNSKFDTLYLYRANGSTPANLNLGKLEVQDNVLHVARTYSTSDAIVLGRISGDSIGRFYVRADGHIFWGDGTSLDTELMRSAPNTLYTPDGLHVVQSIKADSFFTETNGSGFKCNSGAITWVSLTRDSNTGYLNSHYGNLWLVALSDVHLNPAGTVYCHKSFFPYGAGTYSQGDYNAYWNEVNAKSFPDRGCPIWIDAEDAKAILKTIKPHPTKKSANMLNGEEVPQFDYSNMHEILKPASGGDGIKLEVLVYSMYHALMDLIEKVESADEKLD